MRKRLRLARPSLLLALVLWSRALPLGAADPAGCISVKDFGARGDNVTDDTAALQAAFDAQKTFPYLRVFFPGGTYRIRDTIRMYSPNVCGDGAAAIYQETDGKDIFYIEFAWRGTIRDLGFIKGATHLNMGNPNTDQGLLRVENCTFADASGFAVYMRKGSNSSHLIVRGCVFSNCGQVLHATCDWTTLADAWITTARMHDKAAIENRSAKLLCENVVGVPIVTGENDRWIDNYGGLTCRNFRFGGEFGGMTPVYNFAPLNKGICGPAVILDDCWISAQGSGRKCAVYLEEIPNLLTIRNCNLTVPAVLVDSRIDLHQYFQHVRPGMLQLDLQSNTGESGDAPQTLALLQAARKRDTRPEPVPGQLSAKATRSLLADVAGKVKALNSTPQPPAESNGHRQQTDPKQYLDIDTRNAAWDLDDDMDSTTVKNREFLAMAQVGDDVVFVRRAPNGPAGAWPHVLVRNVTIDLDRHPWISWRQKDPGPEPLPSGAAVRGKDEKLDAGIGMPMGFGLRIRDEESGRMVHLFETHTPPWFDYGAKDLRKVFDVPGGRRTFTIKYYPLGAYITGQPGSGFALPGEYQILDFIRAEAE